jgi:hypothetical protein
MSDGPRPALSIILSRKKGTTVVLAAVVAATVMVLGGIFGGLGFATSPHPSVGTSGRATATVSLFVALSAADAVAAGVSPGGWTPVAAAGFAPYATVSLPGPEYVPSYNCTNPTPLSQVPGGNSQTPPCVVNSTGPPPPTPCLWSPLGWNNLSSNVSIVVPAMTGPTGTGLAPLWAIEYVGAANVTLYVIVLDGIAIPYATESGPGCGPFQAQYKSLEGNVIDSVPAAAIVSAWGGAAFLANTTNVSAVYGVVAPVTYEGVLYVCGNSTPPNGSATDNGTCQNSAYSYSVPASWFIEYSSCWLPLLYYGTNCRSPGVLTAELNGSTGAPIFVTISTGWRCGWTPVCVYGPLAQGTRGPAPNLSIIARAV